MRITRDRFLSMLDTAAMALDGDFCPRKAELLRNVAREIGVGVSPSWSFEVPVRHYEVAPLQGALVSPLPCSDDGSITLWAQVYELAQQTRALCKWCEEDFEFAQNAECLETIGKRLAKICCILAAPGRIGKCSDA